MEIPIGLTRCSVSLRIIVLLLGAMAVPWAQAQPYSVLYSFKGATSDGRFPNGLLKDSAGNLYGTTGNGGSSASCNLGCGTVFKLDSAGNETVLYNFTGAPDGARPSSTLVMDASGNLYGTTSRGGSSANCPGDMFTPGGCGTVFKLDTSNHETVLYSFTGTPDGAGPQEGFLMDAAGNLYGTTFNGGSHTNCAGVIAGCGAVFKLDTSNNETILYSFQGGTDGANPHGSLIRDTSGNLYGTNYDATGTVFKLDTSNHETVLYNFTGGSDGDGPWGRLVMDAAGNLYGATADGGITTASCTFGCGTVFKVDTSNHETVVYAFKGPPNDGSEPRGSVVIDPAGNLYGTTRLPNGLGTVFKIDTSGNETILHSFTDNPDGASPQADLLLDSSGNLYGTTSNGGVHNFGSVFKLTVPPAVVSVSPIGSAGSPQTFNATYSFSGDLNMVYLLFNPSINGAGACFAACQTSSNALYLYNDGGTAYVAGTINPGTAGTLSNSQCTIGNAGAVTIAGANLTLPINITFAADSSAKRMCTLTP